MVVSSAPQIRYPDCYGIDMARIEDFIAFKAAIELLKETNQENIIETVYKKVKCTTREKDERYYKFCKRNLLHLLQ